MTKRLAFPPFFVKINLDLKSGVPFSYSKNGLSFVVIKDRESCCIKVEITEGDVKSIDLFLNDVPEHETEESVLSDIGSLDDDDLIELLLFRLQYQKSKQNTQEIKFYYTMLINLKLQRMRAQLAKQIPPRLSKMHNEKILFLLDDFNSIPSMPNFQKQQYSNKTKNYSKHFLIKDDNKEQETLSFTLAFEHIFKHKIIIPYRKLANLKFGDYLLDEITCNLPYASDNSNILKLKAYWTRSLNSNMVQLFNLFVEKRNGISIHNAGQDNIVFSVRDKPEMRKLHPSTTLKFSLDYNIYSYLAPPLLSNDCNQTTTKIQRDCKTNTILPVNFPAQPIIQQMKSNLEDPKPLEYEQCNVKSCPTAASQPSANNDNEKEDNEEDFVYVDQEQLSSNKILETDNISTENVSKIVAGVKFNKLDPPHLVSQTSIKNALESSIKIGGTKNYTKPSLSIFSHSTATIKTVKPQTLAFNFGTLSEELSNISSLNSTNGSALPHFTWSNTSSSAAENKLYEFVSKADTVSSSSNAFCNELTKEVSSHAKKASIKCRKMESKVAKWYKTNAKHLSNSDTLKNTPFNDESRASLIERITEFKRKVEKRNEENSFTVLPNLTQKFENINLESQNENSQREEKNKSNEFSEDDDNFEQSDSEISDTFSFLSDFDEQQSGVSTTHLLQQQEHSPEDIENNLCSEFDAVSLCERNDN